MTPLEQISGKRSGSSTLEYGQITLDKSEKQVPLKKSTALTIYLRTLTNLSYLSPTYLPSLKTLTLAVLERGKGLHDWVAYKNDLLSEEEFGEVWNRGQRSRYIIGEGEIDVLHKIAKCFYNDEGGGGEVVEVYKGLCEDLRGGDNLNPFYSFDDVVSLQVFHTLSISPHDTFAFTLFENSLSKHGKLPSPSPTGYNIYEQQQFTTSLYASWVLKEIERRVEEGREREVVALEVLLEVNEGGVFFEGRQMERILRGIE
ncbi:hypothetical protein TL16_g06256 [Triparma laevis f. inornata]|uniref:Uncharacterized protein n=1 Tax=Triparma laevis f. inornata TaxID=1714386 RepID=A0A9W7E9X7_9STRA|nr:hypothetical protein TL16_g06256 [Triparma laevis f. inornata]